MRRDEGSPQTSSASLPETSSTDSTTLAEAATALMSGQPQLVQLPFPAAGVVPAVVPGSVRLLPQGAVLATAPTTTSSSTSSIFPQPHQPVVPLMPQAPHFYFGPTTAGAVVHPAFNPLQQAPLYQRIQMQIAVQPPSKTVYQRILKPFPSVYLILPPLHTNVSGDPLSLLYEALSAKSHEEGVFVEASVVRNDNGDPLDRAIDGQATARLERSGWNSGVYTATFKKLKLLTTSQQRSGSKFSLCFRLKCSSLALGSLADMVVISNPIEVFSHSQYLGKSDDDRAKTQPGAIKYADNPAGLHLKLMESIHAFKELGGAQETLINYITAIYNQNNPIPSAMVALPPSGLPHVHPQQLPEGFILQHHQAILPSTGERSTSPTGTIFGGTPPNVSPRSSFHSAALPSQPSFPLTPTPRRSSPTSSGSSSPPSSPPTLFAAPPATHAPVPMSVPPHPRASPALFPSVSAAASVPLTPQTAASMLPGIASLLASSGMSLPPLASAATPAPVPSSQSDPTAHRRPSVETLLQQPVHADHMRGGSSLLSSLLLAPLQALSEACRDRTASTKRKAKESGPEHDQRRRAAEADDLGEKEKREVRHKRRRKSAD